MLEDNARRRTRKIAQLEARLAALKAKHDAEVLELVEDQLARVRELLLVQTEDSNNNAVGG